MNNRWEHRHKPPAWQAYREANHHPLILSWYALNFGFEWLAYLLSRWAFLEVLEYLGALSVLVGVIFYFSESDMRKQQKHYQAWQVINTAQGKGGSGGRVEAMQELNEDGVSLVGVDVSQAALRGLSLVRANLRRASMESADLRDCNLNQAILADTDLRSANFRHCTLNGADLTGADFEEADMVGASLAGAKLNGANLKNCDLRNTDLRGITWKAIASIEGANLFGTRNTPADFLRWAKQHGAVFRASDN